MCIILDVLHKYEKKSNPKFHKQRCFKNNSINVRKRRPYLMVEGIFNSRRRDVYQENTPLAFRVFHYRWPTVAELSIFATISIKCLCRRGVSNAIEGDNSHEL